VTNQVTTILLLGVLSAVLVAFGGMLGPGYLYFFTGLAVLVNLGAHLFSDRIVLAMHQAREVAPEDAPRLHAVVEELAVIAELPKPRVFLIEDPHANAFATGRSPSRGVVAVTTGILGLLNERELRGVLGHELGHIKNRDILISSIGAALAMAITHTPNVIQLSALFGGSHRQQEGEDGTGAPAGGLLMALVAPLAATLVQLGISRSREYLADEAGARIAGDPEGLASAREKLARNAERVPGDARPATASLFIVNPLAGPAVC